MPPKKRSKKSGLSSLFPLSYLHSAFHRKRRKREIRNSRAPQFSSPPYLDIQRPASARAIPQAESQVKGSCRMRIAKTAVTTGVA